ncbi:MAG: hypothetical protein KDJ31_09340 [Candidatus Competibacteraceae bacterium]|nr:hypothetical protein [Candidatus Competibacteraceae bacterium]
MYERVVSIGKIGASSMALFVAGMSTAQGQAPQYLSCRILSQEAPEAFRFAGASLVWSDGDLQGIRQLPGGERVFVCSRELRASVCRSFAGPLLTGESLEEGAMNGGYLLGMSGEGVGTGLVIGAGYAMAKSIFGTTMQMARCSKQIELLTKVSHKMSVAWTDSFTSAGELNYNSFLYVLDAAKGEGRVTPMEVNDILTFTDRVNRLIGQ